MCKEAKELFEKETARIVDASSEFFKIIIPAIRNFVIKIVSSLKKKDNLPS